jgi:hypothetical protein
MRQLQPLIVFLFLLIPVDAFAIVMKKESGPSLRLYIDSSRIQDPSETFEQRYSAQILFQNRLPYSKQDSMFGYTLLVNYNPDLTPKSKDVNIFQDLTTASVNLRFSLVYLFRYSLIAGPGYLWSQSRYQIYDFHETMNHYSLLANTGFMLDYAITDTWEIGWMIRAQYRFAFQKWDWEHGFGVGFNF